MTLLIVIIGLLNIGLGFGVAMHFGYGPPGLDGILEALGPMPPAAPGAQSLVSAGLGAAYDPQLTPQSTAQPSPDLSADTKLARPAQSLSAEERVLGEVRDLANTAQTAMIRDQVERRE